MRVIGWERFHVLGRCVEVVEVIAMGQRMLEVVGGVWTKQLV